VTSANFSASEASLGGASPKPRRAAFIDRDGVVNQLVVDPISGFPESPLSAENVELMPEAAAAIARLKRRGWIVVCVTNQPAAAKGAITMAGLMEVHDKVASLLARQGVAWDGNRICLHHPQGIVSALTCECSCRKPEPGMLMDAAAEYDIDLSTSWMIGDTDADVEAGRAAGVRTVLVDNPDSKHKRRSAVEADVVVRNLDDAVLAIEAFEGGEEGTW
jgi:D-glycero-D-manno-heptose 1,7-bisphosphate phosphatase